MQEEEEEGKKEKTGVTSPYNGKMPEVTGHY
jgi:hypothetical protein